MPLTQEQIDNGGTDLVALGQLVNGGVDDPDVVTRSGQTFPPIAKALADSVDFLSEYFWKRRSLTQAEYDDLIEYDERTLYVIIPA